MSTILFLVLSFFVQVLALKAALSVLGQKSANNKLTTAFGVVAMLHLALIVTAFIPFVGWLLKPLVWLVVIMVVYKIGFFKSVGVAIVQFMIQAALKFLLGLIGFSVFIGTV